MTKLIQNTENKYVFLLSVIFLIVFLILPLNVHAVTLNKTTYALDEQVLTQQGNAPIALYNLDSDTFIFALGYTDAGLDLNGVTGTALDSGHYSVLELSAPAKCEALNYEECKAIPEFLNEFPFTFGDVSSGESGSGGGGDTGQSGILMTDKTKYIPNESVSVFCSAPSNDWFEIYDVTEGIDGVVASGGYVDLSHCGSPAVMSFHSLKKHAYKIIEFTDANCLGNDYSFCAANGAGNFVAEVSFSVDDDTSNSGLTSSAPDIHISWPKSGTIFSHAGLITYSATDRNNNGNADERALLGLSDNPVALYYSDSIAEWNHGVIPDTDRTLIANGLPAVGSYAWNIKDLVVGVFYRIVAEAIDATTNIAEDVSDFFTVDFDAPVFTVKSNPPVTRAHDVTISIDASKDLKESPKVTVTQKGGSAVVVPVAGKGSHYEGTYKIVPNQDGAAKISVTGVDLAGNSGMTIVSGSTFAVGIDAPPKPTVLSPRANDAVNTETITVSGTTRDDTAVVLTVNGADTYKAAPNSDGTFTISNVRLSKDVNRGINTLSVSAIDLGGVASEEVPVQVKFNKEPVIVLVSPLDGTRLSGTSVLQARASDENKDPLLFTYQIIAVADFDPTESTSTPNEWSKVADGVPSSKFSWDATEVEDGDYFLRIGADDGLAKIFTRPVRVSVKNTAPSFRFEDGRKTSTATSTATIIGRVLTSESVAPRPTISKIEYSVDFGKKWIPLVPISGAGTSEARFSLTLKSLAEGVRTVQFRAADSSGLSGRANHAVIVDTIPPLPPVILSPRAGAILGDADDADAIQKGLQVHISGHAEANSTVAMTGVGAPQTVKTNAVGAFVFRNVTLSTKGSYALSVSAVDTAGNKSKESNSTFIYDNVPQASILTPEALRGLKGKATIAWDITDADGDTIQNVTLKYRRGNDALKALPIDTTKRTFLWDVSAFPEGSDYQLVLEASDSVASARGTTDFSIDTSPPILTSFALKNNIIGKSDSLLGSGTARDSLSGIEYVEYAVIPEGAKEEHADWVRATVTGGFLSAHAAFSLKHPVTLADGNYRVLARAVDAAGNVSAPLSANVIVDGTPPRVGGFSIERNGVRISPDREGNIASYSGELAFAVSLEGDTANASVTLHDATYPLQESIASGLWEGPITVPEEGTIPLSISAEDERGNVLTRAHIGSLASVPRGSVATGAGENALPVSGAHVRVLLLNENTQKYAPLTASLSHGVGEAETDNAGMYELALSAGSYRLVMQKSGYKTQEETLAFTQAGFVSTAFSTQKLSGLEALLQSITDYLRYDL